MRAMIVMLAALASGCASTPREVSISYELDRYGAAYPVVDGVPYPITDEERRRQVQLLVNEYCPAG